MTPIDNSEIQSHQKQQMNFMQDEDEDDNNNNNNNNNFFNQMNQQQMPSQMPNFQQQQIYPFESGNKKDVFANMDKTAYTVIFIAFILGFFMGKTMQPVILRHS